MVKKIIDVPDDAETFYAEFYNDEGHVLDKAYDSTINGLDDAPTVAKSATDVKCVIELPYDVIEGVRNAKTHYCGNVADFVLNAPSVVFPEIRKAIGEPNASYDKVADILGSWYFGNTEFVSKKEPEFYVRVGIEGKEQSVVMQQNSDGKNEISFDVFMRNEPTYKESEADSLVSGLTALNARKVKVED